MTITCYTAVTGGWCDLKPVPPATADVEYVAFCETPPEDSGGWEIRPLVDVPLMLSPRMAQKWCKLMPHIVLGDGVTHSVYVDASHSVVSRNAVTEAAKLLDQGPFALFRHPQRDCLYAEAEVARIMPKWRDLPLALQVEDYRGRGMPEHYGLWATGTLIRDHRSWHLRSVMDAWWQECCRWGPMCQISLPYVLRREGFTPVDIPHNQWRSPWFALQVSV